MSDPPRPPTPQVLLHRLPTIDPSTTVPIKPSKYIILITASTSSAGKLQIARSVSAALSCPLYQGDSLHESAAKASAVGVGAGVGVKDKESGVMGGRGGMHAGEMRGGMNEARYRRMWLSKMTRTGLLFPEEARAATEGFAGFGGTAASTSASTSTSRRGSASSIASATSSSGLERERLASGSIASSSRRESFGSGPHPGPASSTFPSIPGAQFNAISTITLSDEERRRRASPALMVLTHPELAAWHKQAIRSAVGEYGIGVILVPLDREENNDDEDKNEGEEEEEEDLPILRPLDPRTMTSFPASFDDFAAREEKERGGSLDREMKLRIDVNADVEGKTTEIIEGVRDIMA
ncbi:Uu.00g100590.m01.CDS01 [Anthostomella pinea]|uniref:Uu.00g100590.m01.CDS01 n=1 Tax=Anthostomella pinea TaxID=933095 RepID=A0AAI8YCX7_9PEZI|nr:Uu.00g100590.m01.CDS01 [Anthostomella pinea]